MAKRFYTCIIVPNASSRLHKLRIPEQALYALALIGVISFFTDRKSTRLNSSH